MKKIVLTMLSAFAAFSAFSATVADYTGEYQCKYTNEWSAPSKLKITISESATAGKVDIKGLYNPGPLGPATIQADIDLTAGTLTIPFTDMNSFDEGLQLYTGKCINEVYTFSTDPVVAKIEGDKFVFNPEDMIIFGEYSTERSDCAILALLREMVISPYEDEGFVFNEDEWHRIGTAEYPDLLFGYKIFDGDLIPRVTIVDVLQNDYDKNYIALVDPYKSDVWSSVNKDRDAHGYIVIDLSDPKFIVMEPYIYSGFHYNYGGLNLGKTYVYNMEGSYARIHGMEKTEARAYLLAAGQALSNFDYDTIFIGKGSMIFGTESKPTQQYAFVDLADAIVFDKEATEALNPTAVDNLTVEEDATPEYFDLMGRRVANPAPGAIYICKMGEKTVKVAL